MNAELPEILSKSKRQYLNSFSRACNAAFQLVFGG